MRYTDRLIYLRLTLAIPRSSEETLKKMKMRLKRDVYKVEPDFRLIKPFNNYGMASDFKKIATKIDKFKESMVLEKGKVQGPTLTEDQQEKYNEMMQMIQRFAWHMKGPDQNVDAARQAIEEAKSNADMFGGDGGVGSTMFQGGDKGGGDKGGGGGGGAGIFANMFKF